MATDNNQNNERIDILEAALQALAASQEALAGAQRLYEETQQQQTAAIQRHDMDMEISRATQRALAASQQDQAAAIERHDMRMEMLQATQDQVVNLIQTMSTMLYGVIDTQQEHSNDIRDLRENRDNAP